MRQLTSTKQAIYFSWKRTTTIYSNKIYVGGKGQVCRMIPAHLLHADMIGDSAVLEKAGDCWSIPACRQAAERE